jgi:Methane oxygenase PmoA
MKMGKHSYTLFLTFALLTTLATAQVKVEVQDNQIAVSVNGKPLTALQQGKDANKPYLSSLFTASGKRVTRGFPMEKIAGEATDHPHQRGIWMGFEHVSGMNLWEIDPADTHPHMGTIQFQKVIETHSGDKSGGFTVAAQWINQDGVPIIDETLALTFYAEPTQNRMFDVDLQLKAIKEATFEDSRDGIIGIRLATPFDESHGGKVINAEGIQGAKQIEGLHSPWVDWQADLEGEKVGITMMDSPKNRRAPTTWISRDFGLLFANPFAQRYYDKSREDGSMSLQPGDELRLRYRFLVHSANTDIATVFKEFSAQ